MHQGILAPLLQMNTDFFEANKALHHLHTTLISHDNDTHVRVKINIFRLDKRN